MDSDVQARDDVAPSKYWRRFLAFLIDWFLLFAPFSLIGWVFSDRVVSLGSYGRVIGWVVAFVYFLTQDSSLAGGQTIGKRLLRLKVIGANGRVPGIGRAAVRTLVLTAPIFLNGFIIPSSSAGQSWQDTIFGGFVFLVVFGGSAAFVYLWLFNRKTKQLLHDLTTGTFVVFSSTTSSPATPTAFVHKILAGALCALGAVLPLILLNQIQQSVNPDLLSSMTTAQQAIQSLPEVMQSSIIEQHTVTTSSQAGKHKSSVMVIVVTLNQKNDDLKRESARVASLAIKHLNLKGDMPLMITVRYGYDFGVVSSFTSLTDTRTVNAWMDAASKQLTENALRRAPGLPGEDM